MNTKLFYAVSKRLSKANEELESQKSAKNFGTLEFISAKVKSETLREIYNLLYLCNDDK